MKAFQRKSEGEPKAREMVFDGTNGRDVIEWSRDENLTARFQHRPELPEEHDRQARVLLVEPLRWEVVPPGSTISLDGDGDLVLTLPEPEPDKEDKTE